MSSREREHHFGGKLTWLARCVLAEVSESEFLSQPRKLYVKGQELFARALRAEVTGDLEGAGSAYRAYLALPTLSRHLDSPFGNPLVERWIEFRLAKPFALG